MAQMNISIPEPMKAWCEGQVAAGRYSTTSDYVRDLIRGDQDRREGIAAFQKVIDDAIASGVSPLSIEEIFAEARRHYAG